MVQAQAEGPVLLVTGHRVQNQVSNDPEILGVLGFHRLPPRVI